MPRHQKPGMVQFALDVTSTAKTRFETLHESLGFSSKAQTFEAILYFVSTKDKIDPAALQRIEQKLDDVLQRFDDLA